MSGNEYLYALPLQFEENLDYRSEQSGIQIRLGFVPEKYRPFSQRAVLNQKPQETELSKPLGQ